MSESSVRTAKEALLSLLNRGASSYKEKLKHKPVESDAFPASDVDLDEDPSSYGPTLRAIRRLTEEHTDEGAVFQSVTVAALQILGRISKYECRAAEAALSLGQREKLRSMQEATDRAYANLHHTLNDQGAKVMNLCSQQRGSETDDEQPSWWFALTDAMEVLEEGTERMASLTSAQPKGSPAHTLSALITRLLRTHHDELLQEAEQWID